MPNWALTDWGASALALCEWAGPLAEHRLGIAPVVVKEQVVSRSVQMPDWALRNWGAYARALSELVGRVRDRQLSIVPGDAKKKI